MLDGISFEDIFFIVIIAAKLKNPPAALYISETALPKKRAFRTSLADNIIRVSDFLRLKTEKSIIILENPIFIPGIDGTRGGITASIQLKIKAIARSTDKYASLRVLFKRFSPFYRIVIITFAGRHTIFSLLIEISPFLTHILSGHSDETTFILPFLHSISRIILLSP